jgi:hypothetical protein
MGNVRQRHDRADSRVERPRCGAPPRSPVRWTIFTFVLIAVALAVLLGPFAAMTAQGAQRRGNGPWVVTLSGLFFPVAWVVWYLSDEHPYSGPTQPSTSPPGRPGIGARACNRTRSPRRREQRYLAINPRSSCQRSAARNALPDQATTHLKP